MITAGKRGNKIITQVTSMYYSDQLQEPNYYLTNNTFVQKILPGLLDLIVKEIRSDYVTNRTLILLVMNSNQHWFLLTAFMYVWNIK